MEIIVNFFMSLGNLFKIYVIDILAGINLVSVIDILIVSILMFGIYKFIRDRRASKLALGLGLIFAVFFISNIFDMAAMRFILQNFYQVGIIAIIIVFQPELRDALEKVGTTPINIRKINNRSKTNTKATSSIAVIADAVCEMAKERTGALIVLERTTKLGDYIKTGVEIDAKISSHLFRNIFFNKSPLHDGAMIIRDCRIHAAGCFLPLSQNEAIIKTLGTRHRAAIGMSENSDAAVVVVSEETGTVSVAVDGHLIRGLTKGDLISRLQSLLVGDDDKGQESGVQKTIESIGKILPLPKKDKSSEAGSDGKKSGKGKGKDKSKRGEG